MLWSSLSFTGSNLTDIATRNHADLQNLDTASYTHLTAANATDLTDGGTTTLHRHTNVTVADAASDTTTNVLLAGGATGDQAVLSDAGLTYDASANTLSVAGGIGVGSSVSAGTLADLSKNMTGATSTRGVYITSVVQSDSTTLGHGFVSNLGTQNASFTVGELYHFVAGQGTKGASSTITNQIGFIAGSNLTGGTNNYAFFGNIAAASGRWNFYAAGSARNYFAGGVEVVAGATAMTTGFTHIPAAAGAPSGAPTNPTGNVPMYYDTTNNHFYIYNGGWKKVALA